MLWLAVALAICFSGLWSPGHVPPEVEETVSSLATASASKWRCTVRLTDRFHFHREEFLGDGIFNRDDEVSSCVPFQKDHDRLIYI